MAEKRTHGRTDTYVQPSCLMPPSPIKCNEQKLQYVYYMQLQYVHINKILFQKLNLHTYINIYIFIFILL